MTRESIVAEYTTQENYVDEERDVNIKIDKNGNSAVPENVDISDYVTNEENTGLIVNNEQVVKVTNRGDQSRSNLTLSWRRPLSYINQSIDLQSKSMNWFLYDNGLRHERIKKKLSSCLANKWLWVNCF